MLSVTLSLGRTHFPKSNVSSNSFSNLIRILCFHSFFQSHNVYVCTMTLFLHQLFSADSKITLIPIVCVPLSIFLLVPINTFYVCPDFELIFSSRIFLSSSFFPLLFLRLFEWFFRFHRKLYTTRLNYRLQIAANKTHAHTQLPINFLLSARFWSGYCGHKKVSLIYKTAVMIYVRLNTFVCDWSFIIITSLVHLFGQLLMDLFIMHNLHKTNVFAFESG